MPLKGTGPELGDKIAAIITASNTPPKQKDAIKLQWEAICTEIVDHIAANAQVKAGIPVQVSLSTGSGATSATGDLS
ncbi:MAG: hypothetical protein LBB68_09870 [Treponema sp.]|jgi:hypothetical protein|nr:hypothetical protein [Treponema sp.]